MKKQNHQHNKRFLKNDDWFMALIVVPAALLGAIILYIGARDIESHKEAALEYNVDSIRKTLPARPRVPQRDLKNFEDSVHEFEDGM